MRREPLQEDIPALLKRQQTTFMGIEFEVGKGALVPRRDTELLCRTVLNRLGDDSEDGSESLRAVVIDVCCGVGNLACAIAVHLPGTTLFACDLLESATELAQQNVVRHGLENRVTVLTGDLFQPLAGRGLEGKVTGIVCNPPYISSARLEKEAHGILAHEPREAFDAGPYGLAIHQRVCRESTTWLTRNGWLAFEFGAGQGRQVQMVFDRTRRFGPVELIEIGPDTPGVAIAALK